MATIFCQAGFTTFIPRTSTHTPQVGEVEINSRSVVPLGACDVIKDGGHLWIYLKSGIIKRQMLDL